jgi:hypothetical protein
MASGNGEKKCAAEQQYRSNMRTRAKTE